MVNEWYLEDLSENIRKTFDTKRKQGLHVGSFVCYGYKRNPEDKNKLIIDDEVADNVRLIFNLYEQGNGVTKIAQILNDKGIPTPTKYKLSKGFKFNNQGKNIDYWCESTVSKILKNEVYIGNMVQGYNKKVSYKSKKMKIQPRDKWIIVKHTHDAIISDEQFYKVQELFKSKTRRCKNGKVHLFANKLVCKDCGQKLHKCQNDRGYVYFSCKGAKKLYRNCTPHSIGYENLKNLVTDKIREKILAYYNFDDIPKELFNEGINTNKLESLERKYSQLIKEMESINSAIKELYLNKVNGKIPDDVFDDLNSSFLNDKAVKQKKLTRAEIDIANLKEKDISKTLLKEQRENIIGRFKELNYDIVNSFIDFIEIGEKNKKANSQDIIIHWNF